MSTQWNVTQGDNQFVVTGGLAELKNMARRGDLGAGDMIQPPGAVDWIYASEIPELQVIFAKNKDVDDEAEARARLATMGHVPEVSIEEFIDGSEFTYDAVTIDGKPAFESVTQYHPPPLQMRTLEWVSPAQLTLRDPYIPATQCGIALGRQVLEALHMGTGFVHMEWFKNRRGEAVFGEIACRSGGGKLMDALDFANDIDIYREWARAVCWHAFDAVPQRKYHVVTVFKRALGQGRITRIEGLEAVRRRCGPGLVVEDLLPVGHPRRNWKQTLLSDGYVTMRSIDYRDVCEMRDVAVNSLRMYAE